MTSPHLYSLNFSLEYIMQYLFKEICRTKSILFVGFCPTRLIYFMNFRYRIYIKRENIQGLSL